MEREGEEGGEMEERGNGGRMRMGIFLFGSFPISSLTCSHTVSWNFLAHELRHKAFIQVLLAFSSPGLWALMGEEVLPLRA